VSRGAESAGRALSPPLSSPCLSPRPALLGSARSLARSLILGVLLSSRAPAGATNYCGGPSVGAARSGVGWTDRRTLATAPRPPQQRRRGGSWPALTHFGRAPSKVSARLGPKRTLPAFQSLSNPDHLYPTPRTTSWVPHDHAGPLHDNIMEGWLEKGCWVITSRRGSRPALQGQRTTVFELTNLLPLRITAPDLFPRESRGRKNGAGYARPSVKRKRSYSRVSFSRG